MPDFQKWCNHELSPSISYLTMICLDCECSLNWVRELLVSVHNRHDMIEAGSHGVDRSPTSVGLNRSLNYFSVFPHFLQIWKAKTPSQGVCCAISWLEKVEFNLLKTVHAKLSYGWAWYSVPSFPTAPPPIYPTGRNNRGAFSLPLAVSVMKGFPASRWELGEREG